ncbi:MAG: 1-deoxy-D-xylulose-5-phosphate synthase [Nitrospinae bacterium]|nr:1-deoxy-D-xylulose-5-phosphate synthase [Nitrospinota bacterium]
MLAKVAGPADIKGMTPKELERLAAEIRQRIIGVVAKNGGHLASSLGVVELTIALHYVYDSPTDKIVWDVGHQCYAHKIITGRNAKLDTLRQHGGLSGFPSIEESQHDVFNTGHAGTSISVALGLAQGRDHLKAGGHVVAVIGDGSLTAGLAFEGLNHAGSLHTNLTVVLNDNKMSISRNVGALSQHLNRIITGKWFVRMEEEWDQMVNAFAGGGALSMAQRFREAVKGMIIPGRLFEDLGYKYIGPIEGHELSYLIETFQAVRELKGPRLVHVVTTKGKGYQPAEEKASRYHGVSPRAKTGVEKKPAPTYTEVFSGAIVELAERDPSIVAITAAMPDGTGLTAFAERFPDRFFDVGIAEQHATTFAAGLAARGLKPVVAIYSTFLQRVFDQIVHDVCLTSQNVTFAVDRAGVVGEDGVTHQGLFDLTYLRCVPNMVVMAPRDEQELRRMLKTAVELPGPAAVRYPRGAAIGLPITGALETLPIGKGELLRDGHDLVIVAVGRMVHAALDAAELLAAGGHSAAVVDARFVKPLDEALILDMGARCGRILTAEENVLAGGFGSAVLELIESRRIPHTAVRRLGVPDRYVEHGEPGLILASLGLDAAGIARSARTFIEETPGVTDRAAQDDGKKAARSASR